MAFVVLGERGIDNAQQLMNFVTLGSIGQQLFQLVGGLCVAAGLVVRDGRLVLAIELLFLRILGDGSGSRKPGAKPAAPTEAKPAPCSLSPPKSPREQRCTECAECVTQKNTPARHPEGVPYRGVFHLKLVVQLQRKLNLSRIVGIVASRSDFAEVRVGDVARTANRDDAVAAEVGSVEVRMVEDVEELGPELQSRSAR